MAMTPSFRITSSIIDDHINVEKLFQEYQRLKPQDFEAARELFGEIKEELLSHMAHEEEILFPLLESNVQVQGAESTATIRQEHTQIRLLLTDVEQALAKKNQAIEMIAENKLLAFIKAHEEKEEEIFYPWLDKALPEKAKTAAVSQMEIR